MSTGPYISRPRLIHELTGARIGLIEAPGGFGKSVLIGELRDALGVAAVEAVLDETGGALGPIRRGARQAGLSDVAAGLDAEALGETLLDTLEREAGPTLLAVDEVQRASPETVSLLCALGRALPDRHRLVLAGRRLDPGFVRLGADTDAPHLDADSLAFTVPELMELTGDLERARMIHTATNGWPAACALAAAHTGSALGARLPARGLTTLVDRVIAPDPDLQVLGHLPLLSDVVAAACCGPGALDRLRSLGLPLRAARPGWHEIPDPIRENLAARALLPPEARRAVAREYALAGELHAAVDLLRGDGDGLAELLGAQRWTDLGQLELGELRVVLGALPDSALRSHPKVLLHTARLAERSADVALQQALLERALALLEPGVARREAEAALAATHAVANPGVEVEMIAQRVLDAVSPGEHVARARSLLALARVDAWRGDPRSMRQAEDRLEEVVGLCRITHEAEWEATARVSLGYRVCFARGDFDRALGHLTAALALVPAAVSERASMATFLATVLAYVGRFDEAEDALREAADIVRAVGDHRAHAYVDWTWGVLCSLRGDRAGTLHRMRSAERHFGPWFTHPTGCEFLADASLALARTGDEAQAREYATRAAAHPAAAKWPEIALIATGSIEARFGDPARAEHDLLAYADSPQSDARDEWHILLLRAHAALRSGTAEAEPLAAEAQAAAAALGHAELPSLHEPQIARALGLEVTPDFAVRLLGRFHVARGGRELIPPPGRPATLVKLLAVRGPAVVVTVDEIIEILWPDIEPEVGRARLRNLLNRLRAACGDLVERINDGLQLSPLAHIDVSRFAAEVGAVRDAAPAVRPGHARAALAVYTGELLPEDRYADWAAGPRERLRRQELELLHLLVEDAVGRGELDEAIRLLERAAEAEPLDESWPIRAAELLLFQGRRGSARSLVERAVAVRGGAGLTTDSRLARLASAVGVSADVTSVVAQG